MMINNVQPVGTGLNSVPQVQANSVQGQVQTQFTTMFWKEILKQALPSPNLSFGSEQSSIGNSYANDLYIEHLAQQLAKSQAFSAQQFFPEVKGTNK